MSIFRGRAIDATDMTRFAQSVGSIMREHVDQQSMRIDRLELRIDELSAEIERMKAEPRMSLRQLLQARGIR